MRSRSGSKHRLAARCDRVAAPSIALINPNYPTTHTTSTKPTTPIPCSLLPAPYSLFPICYKNLKNML
ncbi:MAG: hypothetical protein F6J90_22635 [Moorea sp. SIOASIH]|nr:hypothetical protein [Moorena sp. SIOASIH]